MKKDLILVVGASGTVGSETVRLLKEQGYRVRTTTSKSISSNNLEQVQVDLATGKGIATAMDGVDKAFFLSPPGFADQYSILSPLIQEAKRRGLKKVVLMTAMGANATETTPFRRAEIELEKSGLNYNIIRPNWFYQNFNTFWIQGIREHKKIMLPAGQAKVSFIDARDIAAVISRLLTVEGSGDKYANQAFDLTGPEAVDHHQVAKAIGSVISSPIIYEEISPLDLKKGLLTAGLPADYVEFLLMIFGFLREGYNSAINNNVAQILERTPRGLQQYSQEYKTAWE